MTENDINPTKRELEINAMIFLVGVFVGIVTASFLHKYIVHPLGY